MAPTVPLSEISPNQNGHAGNTAKQNSAAESKISTTSKAAVDIAAEAVLSAESDSNETIMKVVKRGKWF